MYYIYWLMIPVMVILATIYGIIRYRLHVVRLALKEDEEKHAHDRRGDVAGIRPPDELEEFAELERAAVPDHGGDAQRPPQGKDMAADVLLAGLVGDRQADNRHDD